MRDVADIPHEARWISNPPVDGSNPFGRTSEEAFQISFPFDTMSRVSRNGLDKSEIPIEGAAMLGPDPVVLFILPMVLLVFAVALGFGVYQLSKHQKQQW